MYTIALFPSHSQISDLIAVEKIFFLHSCKTESRPEWPGNAQAMFITQKSLMPVKSSFYACVLLDLYTATYILVLT